MKRILLATTLVSTAAAGTAFAGAVDGGFDDPMIAPAPVPVAVPVTGDWGGAYGGVQLGYGFGEFDPDPTAIDELDTDGIVGGFHVGYNWDLGQWVLGTEFQYDASDLSVDDGTTSGNFDGIARLKGRAGYDLGNSMIYGSAGVAYTNFDGISGVTDIDFDDPGYVVGIGYDYRLNENWVLGAEYQHHMFDDFGAPGNDVDFGTVHLRASFMF